MALCIPTAFLGNWVFCVGTRNLAFGNPESPICRGGGKAEFGSFLWSAVLWLGSKPASQRALAVNLDCIN